MSTRVQQMPAVGCAVGQSNGQERLVQELTEAEYAYRQQREAAMTAKPHDLRRTFARACRRARNGSALALERVKAITEEYSARGEEPPRV